VRLAHVLAVASALGIAPQRSGTRQWADDREPREPIEKPVADRERIARAEEKRARKAAARLGGRS
jgi:hypothetical protein